MPLLQRTDPRFGAFVTTAAEFAGATRKTVDFVAQSVEAAQRLVA